MFKGPLVQTMALRHGVGSTLSEISLGILKQGIPKFPQKKIGIMVTVFSITNYRKITNHLKIVLKNVMEHHKQP